MRRSPRQKSVMVHDFSRIPTTDIRRSKFDRSFAHKTTLDSGFIVPIFCDEIVPGDTMNVRTTAICRMATPIFPIMDNLFLDIHFFFVPNRLVWDNWQKFMGEKDDPADSTEYTVPQTTEITYDTNQLGDYFGLPIGVPLVTNALPFRAYQLIYNEWYRDQNIIGKFDVPTDDGPTPGLNTRRRRGKRHDYFTSCLPWPQKGPGVDLPLGQRAEIFVDENFAVSGDPVNYTSTDGIRWNQQVTTTAVDWANSTNPTTDPSDIYADLSNATAATINDLRQAFAIQRMQERDARGGTRYTEILRSHFGVISPDARLQRPEFLGGGTISVNMTQVPQTSQTDPAGSDASPQGNLAAYGMGISDGIGFTKSFVEHGYVLGLVSVRADLTYQKGVERHWSRETKYDYLWPSLASIGEQAVLNKEIYVDGTDADNDVFGYQERYAEYRYKPSIISGLFRSDADASLDAWHLSQDFSERPALNAAFINEVPPVDRVIAVPDEPQFLLDTYFNYICARPLPVNGVPGYMDHF